MAFSELRARKIVNLFAIKRAQLWHSEDASEFCFTGKFLKCTISRRFTMHENKILTGQLTLSFGFNLHSASMKLKSCKIVFRFRNFLVCGLGHLTGFHSNYNAIKANKGSCTGKLPLLVIDNVFFSSHIIGSLILQQYLESYFKLISPYATRGSS